MKKIFICTLMLILLTLSSSFAIEVNLNGENIKFDEKPYIDSNNRTIVPVRFITEKLGAIVDWNGNIKEVTILLEGEEADTLINLRADEKKALVNNKSVELDTQAVLKNGRVFVPLRFITETFGFEVKWNDKTKSVELMDEEYKKTIKDNEVEPIEESKIQEPITIGPNHIGDIEALIKKTHTTYDVEEFNGRKVFLSPVINSNGQRGNAGVLGGHNILVRIDQVDFYKEGDINPLTGKMIQVPVAGDAKGNELYRGCRLRLKYTVKNISDEDIKFWSALGLYAKYSVSVRPGYDFDYDGTVGASELIENKLSNSNISLKPGEERQIERAYAVVSDKITGMYLNVGQSRYGYQLHVPSDNFKNLKSEKFNY